MRMRERVTIKVNSYAKDALGANIPTVTDLATVWAQVKPVRGQEMKDIGRLASKELYLVTIRHRTDVTTDNSILWGAKLMNIRSVQNRDERKAFLSMECEAGVE